MRARQYRYTSQDIADACLTSRRTIYRAIKEGWFNPKCFWSTFSFVQSWRLSNDVVKEGLLGGREPEVRPVPTLEEAAEKVLKERSELMLRLAVSEKEDQIKALLDYIQRLTDQVASLERDLEECRNLTYDEKMAYWKARALKAEAYAATKNE